jgi:antitoxin (DNA-binding transcriptional repressor) of toxin-antitoxin stability system
MPTADIHQAETELSKLIDAALRGEAVVIARDGVPVVKLVAVERKQERRREPGRFEGEVIELDPDWWKPDDELARLFEEGSLFPDPAAPRS